MIRRMCGLLPASITQLQTRNLRPTIKIGVTKFEITINVHQFAKEELRIKARPEYVIIEGKHERETKRGYILRQFSRKFKLPKGCSPKKIVTTLSQDGTLTITAPREVCDVNLPCEMLVPISLTDRKSEQSLVAVKNEKEDVLAADFCKKMIEKCQKKK